MRRPVGIRRSKSTTRDLLHTWKRGRDTSVSLLGKGPVATLASNLASRQPRMWASGFFFLFELHMSRVVI